MKLTGNKTIQKKLLTALLAVFVFTLQNVSPQDKTQKIDELLQKYYELDLLNSSVLVGEGGRIIYTKGWGMADFENKISNTPQTKFRLASLTKQFTAALILQLVEKGKISLEGKLSDYLPYYRKDTGGKITISQILSHTSGLANYTDNAHFLQETVNEKVVPKEFIPKYCSEDLIFEPGSSWAYSNSGYYILGAVIEEVTGKDYGTVLNENILEPLGMTNSGYEQTGKTYDNKASGYDEMFDGLKPARFIDMTILFSAGAIYSTIEDMYRWDQGLYTEKILSNASKEKMFTPVSNDYGYGVFCEEQLVGDLKKKIITHSGYIFGFNTVIIRFIEDNYTIIILSNNSGSSTIQPALGISNILYGFEPIPPRKNASDVLYNSINGRGVEEAVKEFKSDKDIKKKYWVSENDINSLGFFYLQKGNIKEAVEVFKLNVEFYPESSNVYDSLGEAYTALGDKENAISNYKKSVELDPKNENAKQMLKKLQN